MNAPSARPTRFLLVAVGLSAAIAAMVVLYLFDPATAGFYPVCALYEATGLQCPGCGGLRALHQLTHGNLAAAWQLNPLVFVVVPATLWLGLRELSHLRAGGPWPGLPARPVHGWLAAGGLVLFGVLRNLR
jgi:hypothetical protein